MTQNEFSDETLMAFADGELETTTSNRVAAAAATDESLRARIDAFARSRRMVRDAVVASVPADVPPELVAAVRAVAQRAAPEGAATDTVVTFRATNKGLRSTAWWPSAIAASLALVVGVTAGYVTGTRPGTDLMGTATIAPTVAEALGSEPTGAVADVGDARIAIVGSFRTEAGALCREFRLGIAPNQTYSAIACHGEEGWRPEVVVRAEPGGGSYATASGQAALDAHADALGAGPFLGEEAELAALADLP
jgi:hypothetical protein